jgi:hypothetical protein
MRTFPPFIWGVGDKVKRLVLFLLGITGYFHLGQSEKAISLVSFTSFMEIEMSHIFLFFKFFFGSWFWFSGKSDIELEQFIRLFYDYNSTQLKKNLYANY